MLKHEMICSKNAVESRKRKVHVRDLGQNHHFYLHSKPGKGPSIDEVCELVTNSRPERPAITKSMVSKFVNRFQVQGRLKDPN